MLTAERLVTIGGITAFAVTLLTVRMRDMRERYAVGWLVVATGLLVIGLFPQLIISFADSARLSYPTAVLFVVLGMIYLFSMSVSVSLSHQHKKTLRALQDLALLGEQLERLRRKVEDLEERGASPNMLGEHQNDRRRLPDNQRAD